MRLNFLKIKSQLLSRKLDTWLWTLPILCCVIFVSLNAAGSVASHNDKLVLLGHFEFFKTKSRLVSWWCPTTLNAFLLTRWSLIRTRVLFDKGKTRSSSGVDSDVDQGVALVDEEPRLEDHVASHRELWVGFYIVVNLHMALRKNVCICQPQSVRFLASVRLTVGHSSLWSLQSDIPSHRQAEGTHRPLQWDNKN